MNQPALCQLALDWIVSRVDDLSQPWDRAQVVGWMLELSQ